MLHGFFRLQQRQLLYSTAALGFLLLNAPLLMGQTGGGSVAGAVHDQSGAVVPKADVTLTDVETGTTLTTQALPTGEYLFPVVPVGIYTETVNAPGFAQTQHQNLIVSLNKTVTVDVALQVGTATSTVRVRALASQLETQTSQASTTIDQQTVDDLPIELNGSARSVTGLADLMPGVSDTQAVGYGASGPTAQSYAETINGGQSWTGAVLYDGLPQVTSGLAGDYAIQPVPVEAVQEFSLVQNNFSPEFGHTPGGVLSYSTRAGTNAYHGQAYEYLRNDDFDASGYFATSKPPLHQNEFGVNVGGPITIPRLYNGHNKLFFFAFYSGFRVSEGITPSLITVPTLAERTGDFTGLVNNLGQQTPIYDPTTTSCTVAGVCSRQQYDYNGNLNMIPPNDISAAGQTFNKYLPTPINSSLVNNYSAPGLDDLVENRFGGRVDYNLGTKDEIHGFFSVGPATSEYALYDYLSPLDGPGTSQAAAYLALARLGEDHTFSPNLLLHLGLGYNRDTADSTLPDNNADITFGIPNGLPGVTPTWSLYGAQYQPTAGSYGSIVNEYGVVGNGFLSWTKGKQQFKMGAEFNRYGQNFTTLNNESLSTGAGQTGYPLVPDSGDQYASILVGALSGMSLNVYAYPVDSRFKYIAAYFNDDYKILSNLVLNMGIRYEIPWTRTVNGNVGSSFEPNYPNPGAGGIDGALVFLGHGQYTCNCTHFANTRFVLWQPRFGLAYKLNDKTVVHAGYGIFAAPTGDVNATGSGSDGFNASYGWSSVNDGIPLNGIPSADVDMYAENGYPSYTPPPFINPTILNYQGIPWMPRNDGLAGVIQNYTLNVQRQLPHGLLLDVSYVGNTAQHVSALAEWPDQIPIGYTHIYGDSVLESSLSSPAGQASGVPLPFPGFTGTVEQALSPFPQYAAISPVDTDQGKSNYNSLQVRLQRQFHNGFSLLTSYTWGRIFTNAESGIINGVDGPQDTFNPAAEYAPAYTEAPQTFVVSYVYNLPFGYNRKYLNHGIAASLLGGWGVAGIHHYQDGVPDYEIGAVDDLPIGNWYLRPDMVSGQRERGSWQGKFNPYTDYYINPNSLTQPPPDSFGNAARDIQLRSFGLYDEDLSARKDFHIWEATDFQFRADFFDAFNRVNFFSIDGQSAPSINPSFGTLPNQGNQPRSIQFALKMLF